MSNASEPGQHSVNTATVFCVNPHFVRPAWLHARPLIQSALLRTNLGRTADIEKGVLYGNSLLWLISLGDYPAGACVTDLMRTETELVLVISAIGGNRMDEWLPVLDAAMMKFARAEGCNAIRIMGRKGWMRALENYEQRCVILERRL